MIASLIRRWWWVGAGIAALVARADSAEGAGPAAAAAPPAADAAAAAQPGAAVAAAPVSAPDELPLSSELLAAQLADDLRNRFKLDGEFQIELLGAWTPPARLARAWRIAITEYPSAAGANMLVRFRAYGDGAVEPEAMLMLRASLWRDAWFTTEPLPVGAALELPRIERRRIDAFRTKDAIPSATPASNLIAARAIPAGALLTWRDVGPRPLVRKGEIVEVSASEGMLHITMKGIALQNGAKGDVVPVRNPDSLKTIPALVVAESRVQVRL